MIKFPDIVLIGELLLQSRIAKRAAERLCAKNNDFDQIEMWTLIQTILVATGNVSKILWPIKKYKMRGERLRQFLKIKNDNPLSSRTFRNHFEHYDERVDAWFSIESNTVYIDLAINPSLRSNVFNDLPLATHRGYNSYDNSIVFRNEKLHLDQVMTALDCIIDSCSPYCP